MRQEKSADRRQFGRTQRSEKSLPISYLTTPKVRKPVGSLDTSFSINRLSVPDNCSVNNIMTPSGDLQKFEIQGLKNTFNFSHSRSWAIFDNLTSDNRAFEKTQLTLGDKSMTESFVSLNDVS